MVKPELVAPAGDWASLQSAVSSGADAIYFGVKGMNMRHTASNFDILEIKKVMGFLKEKGKKGYLALNTTVYDDELDKIKKILIVAKKSKVNAVMLWDMAVLAIAKKMGLNIHLSTQASISNFSAAEFYAKLGVKRIVLARELNLKQIKEISKIIAPKGVHSKECNVETFVHGAMCLAISGRCFMSQHSFNSSANRGKCLHNCRRSYIIKDDSGNELKLENNKVLSAKDLCTLPFIEKLKKAGIVSFKIEGRNRDPRYVDTVVRVYRKALDKKLSREEIKSLIEELKKVYNKGFSSGFYLGLPTSDDFSKIEIGRAHV